MTKISAAGWVSIFAFATACGGGSASDTVASRQQAADVCRPISKTTSTTTADWGGTVFTIVIENHSLSDLIGNPDAPFINALARQNAVAKGYTDTFIHPSEPNYLWMVAGQSFSLADDGLPKDNHVAAASHLANQLERAGLSWKAYMESMGEPCRLTSNYPYEPKHNPFVFFDDINGWDGKTFTRPARCLEHVVDYSQFDVDLASGQLPRYVFITPNMINDMHDGSVKVGDAWLDREIGKILESRAFNEGGVIFLTADEGSGHRDDPPMIVISPNAKPGYVSESPFDTSSFLKTVQKIFGLDPLPCAVDEASVATMDELFSVPLQ